MLFSVLIRDAIRQPTKHADAADQGIARHRQAIPTLTDGQQAFSDLLYNQTQANPMTLRGLTYKENIKKAIFHNTPFLFVFSPTNIYLNGENTSQLGL